MKEITLACEAFQKLLEEQLERIRNMNGEKTDFSTKKQVTIGVIDGDGIGPVITAQATRVLEKLLAEEAGEQPLHREGYRGGTWVLLDYGCIAIHVFNQEARAFYGLERLWQDGKSVDLSGVIDEHE